LPLKCMVSAALIWLERVCRILRKQNPITFWS
jgi:hypothetical protein